MVWSNLFRMLPKWKDHEEYANARYGNNRFTRPEMKTYLNLAAREYQRRGFTRLAARVRSRNVYRKLPQRVNKDSTFKHGLVYNPYTKRQVRYTKATTRMVYNPYAKTHTKIKLGKPTHRLIYNPYSKTYSKHECRSPLCGCS